jgi:hypothetical protein
MTKGKFIGIIVAGGCGAPIGRLVALGLNQLGITGATMITDLTLIGGIVGAAIIGLQLWPSFNGREMAGPLLTPTAPKS